MTRTSGTVLPTSASASASAVSASAAASASALAPLPQELDVIGVVREVEAVFFSLLKFLRASKKVLLG